MLPCVPVRLECLRPSLDGALFEKHYHGVHVPLPMVTATLLGTAQDGGLPQAGCQQQCCNSLPLSAHRYPVSLGLVDKEGNGHLIDTTRHLAGQLSIWNHPPLSSIFLTHAHFGHVDGLGLLGKETMNAQGLNLHVSPSMFHLMEETPQWALMLAQGVFSEHVFIHDDRIVLAEELVVEPVHVPHRAELSDMHAFVVRGPNHSLLYLPDHDDWGSTLERHQCTSIRQWLNLLKVDIALIDGTFWDMDELPALRQNNVPHPPVSETLDRLGARRDGDPELFFIHLNHTNPLHDERSEASAKVRSMGWGVAQQGQQFTL